jgi:hypothetical protein
VEKTVTVKLFKDTDGSYAVSVTPLIVTVSPLDEDSNPVIVNWALVEEPTNPGIPNARQLTASFDLVPTPFTVIVPGALLPLAENYSTPESSSGAMATTPNVQDGSVGAAEENTRLYKYTITVETNDGQRIVVDPHVRVMRRRISRDHRDD